MSTRGTVYYFSNRLISFHLYDETADHWTNPRTFFSPYVELGIFKLLFPAVKLPPRLTQRLLGPISNIILRHRQRRRRPEL